jgi:hypothetical protein
MRLPQQIEEWQKGFKKFIEATFAGTSKGETAPCPCMRCHTMSYRTIKEVRTHLIFRGFSESFIHREGEEKNSFEGISEGVGNDGATSDFDSMRDLIFSLISGAIHGDIMSSEIEESNESAKIFFKLLTEAQRELYPGCKEVTKVSFIVWLLQIKCMFGLSNSALETILQQFSLVLPEGHCVPYTLEKVQKVVRDLGLDYQKIHACINIMFYFGRNTWRIILVSKYHICSKKNDLLLSIADAYKFFFLQQDI